jgi:hypothetical protein
MIKKIVNASNNKKKNVKTLLHVILMVFGFWNGNFMGMKTI